MPHLCKIFPYRKSSRTKWRLDCVLYFVCGRFIWPSTKPDIFSSWGWSSCCSSHTVHLLLLGRSNLKNKTIIWTQVTLLCPGPRPFPPQKCVSDAEREHPWSWLSSVKCSCEHLLAAHPWCWRQASFPVVTHSLAHIRQLPSLYWISVFLSLFITVISLSEAFRGGVALAETEPTALGLQRGLTPSTGSSSANTLCCVWDPSARGRKGTDPFHPGFFCCDQLLAGLCYRTYFWTMRIKTVHNKCVKA